MWNSVFCVRLCQCEYHYYFGLHSHLWMWVCSDGPMCGILSQLLAHSFSFSLHFSLAPPNGERWEKFSTYIVLDLHGGRFEISSFWLFHFCFEPASFVAFFFLSLSLSSNSYYYNYYYYSNLLHNPNRNGILISFKIGLLLLLFYFPMFAHTQKFSLCFILFHLLSFVPCCLHLGSQMWCICVHHIVHYHPDSHMTLYKYTINKTVLRCCWAHLAS